MKPLPIRRALSNGQSVIQDANTGEVFVLFGVPASPIGQCDERGDAYPSSDGSAAHAHDLTGRICFSTEQAAADDRVVLHELAHVLNEYQGHGFEWRRLMRRMGQVVETRYEPWFVRAWRRLRDRR